MSNINRLLIFIINTFKSCIECEKPADPPNGKFFCSSIKFEEGSHCEMRCDPGYIPIGKTEMTCVNNEETDESEWSEALSQFACVIPIGLICNGKNRQHR